MTVSPSGRCLCGEPLYFGRVPNGAQIVCQTCGHTTSEWQATIRLKTFGPLIPPLPDRHGDQTADPVAATWEGAR